MAKNLDYMWDTWECQRCGWTWNREQDFKCTACYQSQAEAPAKLKKMSETDLLHVITDYLKIALPGCWLYKIHGGMFSRPGVPDLICVNKGTPIFFELKTNKNKLSDKQIDEIFKLMEAGALVFVPYTVDACREFLKNHNLTEVDIDW